MDITAYTLESDFAADLAEQMCSVFSASFPFGGALVWQPKAAYTEVDLGARVQEHQVMAATFSSAGPAPNHKQDDVDLHSSEVASIDISTSQKAEASACSAAT